MSDEIRYIDLAVGILYVQNITREISNKFAEVELRNSSREIDEEHRLFLKEKCEQIISSIFDRKTDREINDAFDDILLKGLVGALAESLKNKGGKDEDDDTE